MANSLGLMEKGITPDTLCTMIFQLRTTTDPEKTMLLVEGDSDSRFFKHFLDKSCCRVITSNGKINNLETMKKVNNEKILGVLSVVDNDYDFLVEDITIIPNVFYYDHNDLECMLLDSPALEKVLDEHGNDQYLSKKSLESLKNDFINAAAPIGALKFLSLKDNLKLTFKDIKFQEFISSEDLTVNITKMIEVVKTRSQNNVLKNQELLEKIKVVLEKHNNSLLEICCGHHLLNTIYVFFSVKNRRNNSKKVDHELLQKSLSLGYERSYFTKTQLYENILNWESQNSPFKVLCEA